MQVSRRHLQGFAVGLIVGLSLFGLTGAKKSEGQKGSIKLTGPRYQVAAFSAASGTNTVRGWHGYYVVDTRTGKIIDQDLKEHKLKTQ